MDILKRNNITITGTGAETIVFAHGFIGDQTLWRHVVRGFEEHFRVILFDYVGSGSSDIRSYDKQRYSRLEGYAKDIVEIWESLDLKDAIFVGHSISGIIGLIASFQGTSFSNLIMVAPSPRYINDVNYYGGFDKAEIEKIIHKIDYDFDTWARELAPVVVKKPEAPELRDELVRKLLTTDHEVAMNFARATFFADYRKDLLGFKIPSLILQCQQDVMAPIEVGDYLHAHLDNCTLRRLQAKGHFPQLSAPDEVVKSINEFLAERDR